MYPHTHTYTHIHTHTHTHTVRIPHHGGLCYQMVFDATCTCCLSNILNVYHTVPVPLVASCCFLIALYYVRGGGGGFGFLRPNLIQEVSQFLPFSIHLNGAVIHTHVWA